MKTETTRLRALFQAIRALESADECQRFFSDLCTPAELLAMADRWHVAKLLDEGMPYREIYEESGVSTATVTRVARALTHGQAGYRAVLDKNKRRALRA
jgi:TrpR-related protein YerC/YecD